MLPLTPQAHFKTADQLPSPPIPIKSPAPHRFDPAFKNCSTLVSTNSAVCNPRLLYNLPWRGRPPMMAAAVYETSTIYRLGKINGRIQFNHMIFPRLFQVSPMISKANIGDHPTIPTSRWLDTRAGVYITLSMGPSLIYGGLVMRHCQHRSSLYPSL